MSILDPQTGYRRQLNYDEILNYMQQRDAEYAKRPGPGINREATRFVQSPFFERLKDSVYEGLQNQQILNALTQQNEANVQEVSAATGVPPPMINAMPGPPGPPGSSQKSPE